MVRLYYINGEIRYIDEMVRLDAFRRGGEIRRIYGEIRYIDG